MAKKRKKRKRESYLEQVIYAHENGEDASGGYVFRLIGGFILDFFQTVWMIIKWPILAACALGIAACVFVFFRYGKEINSFREFADECVDNSTEDTFKIFETTYIYDKDETMIAKLSENGDSNYLVYDDIPKDAVNAFAAVEDRNFWTNMGVDFKGIVRVSMDYLLSNGDEVAGASTITQQLTRTVFLSREVSVERKMKEMMIAIRLTKKYTKEQIMEYYINDACFSNGIYGLEAASQAYFGVSAKELDLSQIAYLCAIPNRPTYYDPYDHPERALTRRNKILDDMCKEGYITQEACDAAKTEELTVRTEKQAVGFYNYETTYALNCAAEYLMKLDGFDFRYEFDSQEDYENYEQLYEEQYELEKANLYSGGYKIYTALDTTKQEALQEILDDELSFDREVNSDSEIYALQGAVTVIDNDTGKVVAIIGGRSQDSISSTYSLNRAFQSYRQPGSSIKPLIVYTPAMMQDYTPDSTVYDIDVKTAQKKGVDVSSLTGASMSLRSAVVNSKNGCAYQVFNDIGPKYGLSFATQMEFDRIVPADYTLSAALGGLTYGVTTVQMASGYAALVNEGEFRTPTCITSIVDDNGDELYKEDKAVPVYSSDAAADMIDIMKGVIKSGTAASMKWSSSSSLAAAGKTGTTNESKDGWFCGVTPYYTISVWVGYDTPRTLDSLRGGSYPASIWKDAMLEMTDGMDEDVDFPYAE